ncbi:MAG: DUF2711 family protein [Opitutales bacterium]|nr:DUF2711 family protein [Opitutales bacterium]
MKAEERDAPEPDRYAVCASEGSPILEFYRGVFDSCFVLLHPFIKPNTIPIARFCSDSYPSKMELKNGTEPVSWMHILEVSNLQSLAQIDVGLRTGICGLREVNENRDYEAEISRIEQMENIVRPVEGCLPEMIQDRILSSLQEMGYRCVWIGDEFGSGREFHGIDDLKDTDFMPIHGSIFTPDHRVLITTHWDSHFSLVCSDRGRLKSFLSTGDYEGFWCEDDTEIYWSLRSKNTLAELDAP